MTLMWEEIMEQPFVLSRAIDKNGAMIKEIADEVNKRNISSVVIAARGTSDHAGVYAKYVLELLTGIPVSLAAPSVFTLYGGNVNYKNCLVIAISQSGKAADALEVIKCAKAQGAITVSITNFPDSPVAVESQYHLCCYSGLERSVAATKTFTSQLYLLANLAAEIANNADLKEQLIAAQAGLQKTFQIAPEIKELAKRYRFMKECFVLARGINYAIALEAALKIQETTYVRAKAFATSDFHHGPFAMVERDTPVIVYAPEGPSLKDTVEIINKIRQVEADILVISNSQEALGLGDCSLTIPSGVSDFISPFYNAAVAQMFACNLALTKGLNPDSPRGLNKVTITK